MPQRKIVEIPHHPKHRNPIPTCVMLGNLILPSVISGHDPKAPGVKNDAQKQSAQAFINMKGIVEAPGGTTDGIAKSSYT
jgi:enamine deaminase RidA (YjgF/YER057c/UK114 family)